MSRQTHAYPLPKALSNGVDAELLIDYLLQEWWHPQCEIIEEYVAPYAHKDMQPRCVIRHIPTGGFLRYSRGPKQGFFWDVYGEDFQSKELALIALSAAPCPLGALQRE